MKKTLVGLMLGIGLLIGCSSKDYTRKEIFDKIEKERIFSEQEYRKYSVYRTEDYEFGTTEEYYDLDDDGYPDIKAMFDFETKDKAVFIGEYKKQGTNFDIFYYDSDGNGILEDRIDAGKFRSGSEDNKNPENDFDSSLCLH